MPTGLLERVEEARCLLTVPTLDPEPHFKVRLHEELRRPTLTLCKRQLFGVGRGDSRKPGTNNRSCNFSKSTVCGSNRATSLAEHRHCTAPCCHLDHLG